jgi:CHASE2 domain-containing sensor protein
MSVAAGFNQRHPRGVIVTRGLVALWLLILSGILLMYGMWGVALFTLAAAVVHVVVAYRVYRSMPR